ncbi:hypothetical protein ACFZCF_29770 [Streptomyces sp. NPDC007945]|uniref:hypothetical protein n=1 Tax=Streptomyces sp. NPDC007945 TaxID=3364797 RepID=UPI0036ED7B5E
MSQMIPKVNANVQRPDVGGTFTKAAEEQLVRLVGEPWVVEAETNERIFAAERQANAPLVQLLEEDADAVAASQGIGRLRRKARIQSDSVGAAATHTFDDLMRDALKGVKKGLNVFVPPYDWVIDVEHKAGEANGDKAAGTFSSVIEGYYGSGASWATAGVGVALKATVDGVANIRPPMSDSWRWFIDATLFSANTSGSCRVVVQDPVSGAVLGPDGDRSVGLWNHTSQTGASGYGSGSFFASDIAPTATLSAGQVFNVNFLANVFTDQSGSLVFGHSYADGRLEVSLPFFVVQM